MDVNVEKHHNLDGSIVYIDQSTLNYQGLSDSTVIRVLSLHNTNSG